MKESDVRERAFAMPLTSPAFPPGPYRFVNREYLIITYRTDPEKLRALVPEPLEVDEPHRQIRVHPHAGFDRLRRLHRDRPGHSGHRSRAARAATRTACSSTTIRRSPAAASSGAFPRSSPTRRSTPRSTRWSARSTTARCGSRPAPMGYKHRAADLAAVKASLRGAELPAQDHSRMSTARRASASSSSTTSRTSTVKGAWTGPAALALHAHALAPVAELPVLEVVSARPYPRRSDPRARQGRSRLSR